MIRHLVLLVASLVVVGADSQHATADSIAEATSVYQAAIANPDRSERMRAFREAELLFRKAIDDANGTANEHLYANLGTTCLSAERFGPAIVAYRKALLLQPDHPQSIQNLEYARKQLPQWAQRVEPDSFLAKVATGTSRRWLDRIGAGLFLVACVLFAVAIKRSSGFLKLLALFPLTTWIGVTVFLSVLAPAEQLEAVVVGNDVVARSADSLNSSSRFGGPLPSGTELQVLEERNDWLQVSLNKQTAWIPRSSVEFVTLP